MFDSVLTYLLGWLPTFAVIIVILLLTIRFRLMEQPLLLPRELGTDTLYMIFGMSYGPLRTLFIISMLMLLGHGASDDAMMARLKHGAEPFSGFPVWVNFLLFLFIKDVMQYVVHRWFHGARLWRFHAVHHAPPQLDWHHAYRFHPVNFLLYATLTSALTLLLGFPLETLTMVAAFDLVFPFLVHANLNWTYGPFRYVLASPVFHRWHHSAVVLDKNFAPTFPFIDWVFGTFYMPKEERPTQLGIGGDPMPRDIWGQMKYPFVRPAKAESTETRDTQPV